MSSKIKPWVYDCEPSELSEKFLMLPPELLENENFQDLSYAARAFYIMLCVHKETEQQRSLLFKTLTDYNRLLDLGKTKEEIQALACPNKHRKDTQGYFVIPEKHLQDYGWRKSYACKLKKELTEKGFIKAIYAKKTKNKSFDESVTVYQFINDWKKVKHSLPEETP